MTELRNVEAEARRFRVRVVVLGLVVLLALGLLVARLVLDVRGSACVWCAAPDAPIRLPPPSPAVRENDSFPMPR